MSGVRRLEAPAPNVPYDLEMEQCALGAMLMFDGDAVTKGMRRLNANHFYTQPHRYICQAIFGVVERQIIGAAPGVVHVDIAIVADVLRRKGHVFSDDEPRGVRLDYLPALTEICPSSANIDAYIDCVIRDSKLRHLDLLGKALANLSSKPEACPERVATFALNAAQRIQTHGWCNLKDLWENTQK